MKIIYVTLFLIFFLLPQQLLSNELKNATSPYLLQHASNPVDWMPWGKKAFEKAQREHKAIFVSIGYSTCHWCHVMERESFTNKKIAQLLNKYFISIKVDREELPQIDLLYQTVYKRAKGRRGGWPLSVFMTPQKEVFYITTYIPPKKRSYSEGMDTLLPKLHRIYEDKKLLSKEINTIKLGKKAKKKAYEKVTLKTLATDMKSHYDDIYIGFGKGKKFPEAARIALMLDLSMLSNDLDLRKDAFSMLDTMALRGLYDHVDGGFFRYCVDASWEIPHFEKMLYNQAELMALYTRAYLLTKKELYKKVVLETAAMSQKFFASDGVYWSASDADVKGEEGAYYTFTLKEIDTALKNNPYKEELKESLDMYIAGNFEGKEHLNFFTDARPKGYALFRKNLQKIRAKREKPFIDKKINTAWNAMMIDSLFQASVVDRNLAKNAEKSLEKLTDMMFFDHQLHHQTLISKKATQKGILEDYAYFIAALISAYEVDYDLSHLHFAEYLLMQAKEKFYKNGVWYLSDDDLHIKADVNDKYYTSALSKMVENVIKLAALKASFSYEKFAQKSMQNLLENLAQKKTKAPALARDYLMQKYGVIVLKSRSENLVKNASFIRSMRYPYLLTKAQGYDDYLACTLRQCFAKENDLKAMKKTIEMFRK